MLAFGLMWVVWVPRAAGVPLDFVGQAWTWIPAVAALLAAALTGGRPALRDLGSGLVRWRVGWRWYLVVILGPAMSLIFTWVFLHTRGSVLLAMLLHGATNLFGVSPDVIGTGELTLPLLAVAAKWALIVVLIVVAGPNLARGARPEALPKA